MYIIDKSIILQRSWTPLHRAAYEGVGEIIDYLLSKGADMYKQDLVCPYTLVSSNYA